MSDATKAVFASYAREDTDAARRVAVAIRWWRSDGVSPLIARSAARDSRARRRDDPSAMSSRSNDTAPPHRGSQRACDGDLPSDAFWRACRVRERLAGFFQRVVQCLLAPRALDFGDLRGGHFR
ncbi:MAG: hypothetical protein RL077_4751 [Verrucomicrobiota bacterium]